ncbi:hypothetical protein E2C01_023209 [Portunus trituberculatus]|uniref:Uncharacterized protein n=1 Tax=Portunus trituberculatus TaxID=210409 RepID=A0A5B7E9E4_PORTR|nr:hypothetical protein [Portunus trituberculatus]
MWELRRSRSGWPIINLRSLFTAEALFVTARLIFTVFSIIIIVAAWDSPLYRAWGSVLVLCVNSAILVRTLPPVVMQLKFKQLENTPMNQVFIIIHLLKSKIAVIKLNENERLTDNEEVASQDNTDEQTPHDLLA